MKYNPLEYDVTWRPNYEFAIVAGWGTAALGCLGLAELMGQPLTSAFIASSVCALLGCTRLRQAVRLYKIQKHVHGRALEFITLDEVKDLIEGHTDQLWLGYGFLWENTHAQRAFEILKRNQSEILKRHNKSPDMGMTWIHGLEHQEHKVYQPMKHVEGHTLILGTTGSGKTRCFDTLVSQAILRNETVIIIDPKGDKELCDNAERVCKAMNQPERFVKFHPAFPESSIRLNPLRNFSSGTELASRIAALIPSEGGGDPFKAYGQMALNNIVQGLLFTNTRPDLKALRRYIETGEAGLVVDAISAYALRVIGESWLTEAATYLDRAKTLQSKAAMLMKYYQEKIQPHYPNSDLEGLLGMFQHDKTHLSKMIASLLPILNMLTSGEIGHLLSPDVNESSDTRPVMDNSKIINNGMVAYIGLDSLTDGMVSATIGSIFLSDLTAVAGNRYNYGVNNRPVNIFVDEAAEVINDPFIQLLNKGRGAAMRLFVATQTIPDFTARLGNKDKALQVLGNINNVFSLRINDPDSQEFVVNNIPKTRVKYVMRTQGISTNTNNPATFGGNTGERLMEEEADLFPAPLLGMLPNLEYVAKISGGYIYKGRLPILVENKETH
ncbi:conjugal transfer protein [Piscirickettsia litoralis]|uniref:Conjugal transfer protein n=1 Tax=Piscirickettsia litoralis TaxID=1891921 RepID=A0ABX2ZXW5_9GAMM|nr:conjugal transfer protein [Piscirickettsia litoralis]